MASTKEFNRKIASLKNTGKITKTMKMVSASKLRRAQEAQRQAQDFAREVNNLIYRFTGAVVQGQHPLLTPRDEVKKVLLLVFTSDKGLCGGFNNNLIRFVGNRVATLEAEGKEVTLSFCGRRGFLYFQNRVSVGQHYTGVTAKPQARDASAIADALCADFVSGEFDEISIVYNQFQSALSQEPLLAPLLPLQPAEFEMHDEGLDELAAAQQQEDFIAEPEIGTLLELLIPRLVVFKIFYALLENAAGEHGARMTAMDNASTNAIKMIDHYTLLRNRARQAAITTELIEIVAGAEAL